MLTPLDAVRRLLRQEQMAQGLRAVLLDHSSPVQMRATLNHKVAGSSLTSGSDSLLSPTGRREKDEGTRRG